MTSRFVASASTLTIKVPVVLSLPGTFNSVLKTYAGAPTKFPIFVNTSPIISFSPCPSPSIIVNLRFYSFSKKYCMLNTVSKFGFKLFKICSVRPTSHHFPYLISATMQIGSDLLKKSVSLSFRPDI